MERISVVGTTGSGKTTLANIIAARLEMPRVELDALRHGPGWTETPDALFRERVAAALSGARWVVDGNYGVVRDLVWSRADTVIWLDYSFPVSFARLLRRTARRIARREELWNGNRETLSKAFSADSILLWHLRTYRRRRKTIPKELARPPFAHLRVIRHRSPRETECWLSALQSHVPPATGFGEASGGG